MMIFPLILGAASIPVAMVGVVAASRIQRQPSEP